ncbi:hypothetical protein [Pseudomonas fontis]|uniref:Type 1 fimbrial protein n=1 Tax=Pseudomonas fontis TaxID=2942633 RepID=A0ABT5NZ34_9PSED|nr:hypothetical protein [Pseudomonas fontis]MDD0977576.1 hypothetical protein [Pseudomonas fontis]MDD0993446.1 hypothetical protein [Pseudomonas fontis]
MLLSRSFIAALAMLGAGSAVAATTASMQITGKIVPPVCDVSLTMPIVELGSVELDASGGFRDRKIPFGSMGVSCSAKTYVRVSVKGTMPGETGQLGAQMLGGWSQKGVTLSSIAINTQGTVINGLPGKIVMFDPGMGVPGPDNHVVAISADPNYISTFMLMGGKTVEAVKTASFDLVGWYGDFVVKDHSSEVTADQTLTFEVNYL